MAAADLDSRVRKFSRGGEEERGQRKRVKREKV
jgi:hypothetical protein